MANTNRPKTINNKIHREYATIELPQRQVLSIPESELDMREAEHLPANESVLCTPDTLASCYSCPEEEADDLEWDRVFASTTDEEFAAFAEDIRASIRKNGSTPLDFNRR